MNGFDTLDNLSKLQLSGKQKDIRQLLML